MAKQNTPEAAQGPLTGPLGQQVGTTPTQPETAPANPPGAPAMSDTDKDRIQKLVAASSGRKFGLNRLPDGSFRMDVTIPVEIATGLESQAECAGEQLEAYIQNAVVEALQAWTWATT